MRVCGSRGQNTRLLIIHLSPRQHSPLGPTASSVTTIITHTRMLDGRPAANAILSRENAGAHLFTPSPTSHQPSSPGNHGHLTFQPPSSPSPRLPHLGQSISLAKAQGDMGAVALVTIATQLLPGHRAQKQAPELSQVELSVRGKEEGKIEGMNERNSRHTDLPLPPSAAFIQWQP